MATTRNKRFKSPPPRLPYEGPSKFLHKLEPWYVRLAQFLKEQAQQNAHKAGPVSRKKDFLPVPPAALPEWPCTVGEMFDLLTKVGDSRFAEAISAIKQRIPSEALTTDLNQILPNVISLFKYHTTVPELQSREMQGDRKAGRQLVETADLYNRWIHEQLPSGGVRLKTNGFHNMLMLYGLAGGLERLTPRELTDFFDWICPCGDTHTLEVLRRLRQKLLNVLERGMRAAEWINTP